MEWTRLAGADGAREAHRVRGEVGPREALQQRQRPKPLLRLGGGVGGEVGGAEGGGGYGCGSKNRYQNGKMDQNLRTPGEF